MRRTCDLRNAVAPAQTDGLVLFVFCHEVSLYLWCLFDLQLTSATHLVYFLHKQKKKNPLLSFLFIIFLHSFFSFHLSGLLFKCRHLVSSGAFFPPSAPQLIVTGLSIKPFALYYYTRLEVWLQNKAASTSSSNRRTKLKRKSPSFLLSLITSKTLNK